MPSEISHDDADLLKWSWLDKGTKKNNRTYYGKAQAFRSGDNKRRVFETGDSVCVAGDTGHVWIAQVLEMYEVGIDPDGDEVELVEQASTGSRQMHCGLRWFYNAYDESIRDSRRVSPHIPTPVQDEIYFSDHIEYGKANHLQVIESRAFLCSTLQELHSFDKRREDFWEGDVVRLVRCFYGHNSGSPPPIRELGTGELASLLKYPTTYPYLYEKEKMTMYGPRGAVLKGTGMKRRAGNGCANSVLSEPDKDIYARKETDDLTSSVCLSAFEDEISSKNLKEISVAVSLKTSNSKGSDVHGDEGRAAVGEVVFGKLTPSDKGLVQEKRGACGEKATNTPTKLKSKKKTRKGEKKKTKMTSQLRKSKGDDKEKPLFDKIPSEGELSRKKNSSEQDEMQEAWNKLEDCLREGTKNQQREFVENIPQITHMSLKIMKERNLSFAMNKTATVALAKIIAKNIFGCVKRTTSDKASCPIEDSRPKK